MNDTKKLYQEIYEKESWYGNSKDKSGCRCPGVAFIKFYIDYLEPPIIDLGCGRGDTVELIKNKGFECYGYDQIEINKNMFVADITKPIDFAVQPNTIICMDVIEHIDEKLLEGLFQNFKKSKKQVLSIHNGPSILKGKELHITKKPFSEWEMFIENQGFNIENSILATHQQKIFFTSI